MREMFHSMKLKKFIRDIEEQKNHGIFLSQHSGISSKTKLSN